MHASYFVTSQYDSCRWKTALFGIAFFFSTSKESSELLQEWVWIVITGLDMCKVWTMYRSGPLRSTLNTNVITGLDMCKVSAEAVHCVALWTRTLSQIWAWHSMYRYRSSPLDATSSTNVSQVLDMCKVCTEAVHCVALGNTLNTNVITGLGMCEACAEAVHCVALPSASVAVSV